LYHHDVRILRLSDSNFDFFEQADDRQQEVDYLVKETKNCKLHLMATLPSTHPMVVRVSDGEVADH
jgi:hypothetical protein